LLKVIGISGAKLMVSFIIGGAVGNLIDRLTRKYVVDFFYFKPKKSPVFNLADFFVIIGTIGLQLLLIFKKEINRI
jgi:signal peptidase II